MHHPLDPHAWLAEFPLLPNERIFAVLGSASDAKPLAAWQAIAGAMPPQPNLGGHGLCAVE